MARATGANHKHEPTPAFAWLGNAKNGRNSAFLPTFSLTRRIKHSPAAVYMLLHNNPISINPDYHLQHPKLHQYLRSLITTRSFIVYLLSSLQPCSIILCIALLLLLKRYVNNLSDILMMLAQSNVRPQTSFNVIEEKFAHNNHLACPSLLVRPFNKPSKIISSIPINQQSPNLSTRSTSIPPTLHSSSSYQASPSSASHT